VVSRVWTVRVLWTGRGCPESGRVGVGSDHVPARVVCLNVLLGIERNSF